jgi:hypothetical protein
MEESEDDGDLTQREEAVDSGEESQLPAHVSVFQRKKRAVNSVANLADMASQPEEVIEALTLFKDVITQAFDAEEAKAMEAIGNHDQFIKGVGEVAGLLVEARHWLDTEHDATAALPALSVSSSTQENGDLAEVVRLIPDVKKAILGHKIAKVEFGRFYKVVDKIHHVYDGVKVCLLFLCLFNVCLF